MKTFLIVASITNLLDGKSEFAIPPAHCLHSTTQYRLAKSWAVNFCYFYDDATFNLFMIFTSLAVLANWKVI